MSDTPDDPMQDDTVLASAYLDGEVTPDERALVESSDELLTEVDRLRRVRAIVGAEVEPAAVSTRESQLAAALDVFDQLGTGAGPPAVAPISTARGRRARRPRTGGNDRMRTVLGIAAGLVIVAGAGAVIRGVIVGTGADDDADTTPAEEPAEDSGIGPSEDDIMAELDDQNTNDDPSLEFDESEVASDVNPEDVLESESALAEEPAEEPADESIGESAPAMAEDAADAMMDDDAMDDTADVTDPDSLPSAEDPPPEADVVELITVEDLADFAAPAAYAPDPIGGVDADITFAECGQEPPAGLGLDRLAESAIVGGEILPVGIDLDRERAFVFRDDCSVVLEAALPSEEEFLASNPVPPTTQRP